MKFRLFISLLSISLCLSGCFRDDGMNNSKDNENLDSLGAEEDNGQVTCHELDKEACHEADECRPQWGEICDDDGCREVVD